MAIQTMFPTTTVRPRSQYSLGTNIGGRKTGFGPFHGQAINVLRDTCSLPTLIFLGCLLQCLLSAALPWFVSIVPVLLYFSWNFLETTLTLRGLREDPYLEGVIQGKFSVAYPAEGQKDIITDKPGDNGPGAVMILGSRSNHTLGMFAPGFREVGDYFRRMVKEAEKDPNVSGFMGMSSWMACGERQTSNEYSTISYWRSIEDVHNFALSPVHREAWNWWNKAIKEHPHVGIMHEIFEVPKHNGWEGIYINYHKTGLAGTTRPIKSNDGKTEWLIPVIDASQGVYRTSKGRLAKGDEDGSGNDQIAPEAYAKQMS